MTKFKENFVIDEKGNPVGVLLDITEYRKLMKDIEELEAIRAYDAAKAAKGEAIPFEQAITEIEQTRG
jgi:hypothetical protein